MFPAESVAIDEEEVSAMVDKLSSVCQIVADALRICQISKKSVTHLEMELAKI